MTQHGDRVEVVSASDADPVAMTTLMAKTLAKGYALPSDLLVAHRDPAQADAADCVVLTTPSGLHPRQAIELARAGINVMTEKPKAIRWQEGLPMVKACDESVVHLFVVKQSRRNRTLELLKQVMDSGRFGRLYSVGVNVFWSRSQSYYGSAAWRGTWEFDGGAFMNEASDYIDQLDWICGPIESVLAYTGTLARNIEVEGSGMVALKWRSGAMGTLNVTLLTYPKNCEGSSTPLGERGSVRVGGVAVNEAQHWQFDAPYEMDELIRDASHQTTSVYGCGHPMSYDNVIKTARGEDAPETDGREGLKSPELLIAMNPSARDGRRINPPLAQPGGQ